MDSRERTFRALNFEEPDRVPIDLWLSEGFKRRAGLTDAAGLTAFLDAHDVDLRYIAGPDYVGPPPAVHSDGCDEDVWGVRRRQVEVAVPGGSERYREVAHSPLADATTATEVEDYDRWPSPDWFDCGEIEGQCERVREQGRVAVFVGDRMNRIAQLKPAMYLRGMEQIYMDMAAQPEIAHAVLGRIRGFYLAYEERILEAAKGKLDLLLTGDDFGGQAGPLVAPDMWAAFLGAGFGDYVALAKAHGVRVMHHTCGAVRPLIPLLIDRGLDVLQSLQPEAAGMEPAGLKADFGGRLAFHGGISIQHTMPFGTADAIRAEVQDRVAALAPGGGYILGTAHNIQADTPPEKVETLLAAYRECGRYS